MKTARTNTNLPAEVRVARRDDRADIRRIFTATIALGRPVTVDGIRDYADFSLNWYLHRGPSAVSVHLEDRRVTGYVLVCTDEDDHAAHQRRATVHYLAALARLAAAGRMRGDARRFHTLRLRDGWNLHRNGPVRPADAHIHLNLLPGFRATQAGRRLIERADRVVAEAGHDAWYAQINAPVGRRADALARLGAQVVHRGENQTLTELVGRPVERLTILRRL